MATLNASLAGSGFDLEFQDKCKSNNPIKKFFINDSEFLNQFSREIGSVSPGEKIKIKFELDVLPPDHQIFIEAPIKSEFSATVVAHDLATCMGQKIHAVLCRGLAYGIDIVKGRDLYDLEWYLQKSIRPNCNNLQACLFRIGPWKEQEISVNHSWIVEEIEACLKTKSFETILEDLKPLIDVKIFSAVSSRWNKTYFVKLAKSKLS